MIWKKSGGAINSAADESKARLHNLHSKDLTAKDKLKVQRQKPQSETQNNN